MILYLPFNGNADDVSGMQNHGAVFEPTLTEDRFGNPMSAYFFDGENDYIDIPASISLDSISDFLTMSAWVKPINKEYSTIICKGFQNYFMQLLSLRPGIYMKGLNID